jgi:hypothetical protein
MKNSISHRLGAGIAALLLTTSALVLTAPVASAAPTGCNYGSEGSFSWAHCTGGTGGYQAWAQCKPLYPWIKQLVHVLRRLGQPWQHLPCPL